MPVLIIKELRANWRSFRYPAFILVLFFFAILDPLMLKYMNEIVGYFATGIEMIIPDPTPEEAFLSYLSDVSQIGIVVLIFMSMGIVAREKETGVAGWLLSKPISRRQYLASKLVALYALVIISIFASSTFAYLYTTSLLGQAPLGAAALATTCLATFTLLIATLNFTLSTLLKTPLQAGGLTLLIFFISGILNMLVSGSAAAEYYPNTLLAYMKPLLEGTLDASALLVPLTVTLVISVLLITAAGTCFTRMEL